MTLKTLANKLKVVKLDATNLKIHKVVGEDEEELNYELLDGDQESKELGSYLLIHVAHLKHFNQNFNIKVYYETLPNATVFSWLEPKQTAGGKYPYLYSQCEPIYCR